MHNHSNTDIQNKLACAEAHCREHAVRLTDKRKQVLMCLLGSEKALSAYDVADAYSEQFDEKISAMSVYRILEFLEQQHLAHRLQLANKYVACVHIACTHEHHASQFVICVKCDRVKEVSMSREVVEQFKQNVKQAGFVLASPQLEVNGICESCQQESDDK